MAKLSKKIGFMGSGAICEVLLHGMVSSGTVDTKNIFIYDVRESRLEELKARYGVNPAESNLEVIKSADYVFSCVRSEYAAELAEEIASADMGGRTLITISSGVPMMLYESKFKGLSAARALPNPPSRIGEGAIVIAFNKSCAEEDKRNIMSLFGAMGKCFEIREEQIDAATAVTGPAYPLSLFQAAVEASVLLGFDVKMAQEMVMQTIRGVLKTWENDPDKIAQLLSQAATPGGISARMIYFLDKERFKYAVKGCIEEGALRTKAFGEGIKARIK